MMNYYGIVQPAYSLKPKISFLQSLLDKDFKMEKDTTFFPCYKHQIIYQNFILNSTNLAFGKDLTEYFLL